MAQQKSAQFFPEELFPKKALIYAAITTSSNQRMSSYWRDLCLSSKSRLTSSYRYDICAVNGLLVSTQSPLARQAVPPDEVCCHFINYEFETRYIKYSNSFVDNNCFIFHSSRAESQIAAFILCAAAQFCAFLRWRRKWREISEMQRRTGWQLLEGWFTGLAFLGGIAGALACAALRFRQRIFVTF
jgi:hypothetical protein